MLVVMALFALTGLNSCHKSQSDSDKETQTSADNATAEVLFNDVFNQVALFSGSNSLFKIRAAVCDTSWLNQDSAFPRTMTIAYRGNNCVDTYGVGRTGSMLASFSNLFKDSLAVVKVSFNGYSVSNYKIAGIYLLTNTGHNSAGHLVYTMQVTGDTTGQSAVITTPSGKTILWSAQHSLEWVQGDTSSTFTNPVLQITGTARGFGQLGTPFTETITTALKFAFPCRWPESGVATISPGNLTPRTDTFGSGGSCVSKVNVSFSNQNYTETMP